MKKKNELPGWFPFALVASGLIAIGAGIRSNWGRAVAAAPPPQPATPPVKQAGVVQGWPGVRYG
jgi:hypothetical protein